MDELIGQGCLKQHPDRYNILTLTEKGHDVLFGREPFFITETESKQKKSTEREIDFTQGDPTLFEKLKALRYDIARKKGLPPYIIFSDKTLHEMSVLKPVTPEDFLEVSGVGEKKLNQYGRKFIPLIQEYRDEHGI